MSGGSYDYAYHHVDDMADAMAHRSRDATPLRRAFIEHMRLVARAMHAVEWNDSGDGADEDAAIRAVLGEASATAATVEFARRDAAVACLELLVALGVKP